MGKTTSIAWTDSTFNFVWGCTKISPGCANCYMYRYSERTNRDPFKVTITKQGIAPNVKDKLDALGEKIFINDMSDTFHQDIDDDQIATWIDIFGQLPNHQFQLLTKRAERMFDFFRTRQCPPNVWLGVSVESQDYVKRIDYLRLIDAKIRYISFEPLLGPIVKPNLTGINWIIIGGESGDNPRFMQEGWAQNLIDYTRANYPECAIFFKQKGGKGRDGAGGDVLNGKQYHEFPPYQPA